MPKLFRKPFRVTQKEREYDGFISYSHKDIDFASRLQREAEKFAKPWYKLHALRLFRDKTNMFASSGLRTSIEKGLSKSDKLILLASPEAAVSEWVIMEVKWWLENRDKANIIILLVAGELKWDTKKKCFSPNESPAIPQILKDAYSEVPLFVDCRWARGKTSYDMNDPEMMNVVAGISSEITGRSMDVLVGEAVRQRKIVRRGIALFVAALLIALATAVFFGITAKQQGDLAREQLRKSQSHQMSAEAILLANSNPRLAAAYALTGALLEDSAEARDAELYVAENNRYVTSTAVVSSEPIEAMATDGSTLLVSDGSLNVAVLEYPSLKRLGTLEMDDRSPDISYASYWGVGGNGKYYYIVDGEKVKRYRAQGESVPTYEDAFAVDFETKSTTQAYVDNNGCVLVLSELMEGVHWSPVTGETYPFDLKNAFDPNGDTYLVAASGFSFLPKTETDPSQQLFYIATNRGEVLRLHLNLREGDHALEHVWLEHAFQNTQGSEVMALGWAYNGIAEGRSLLVGTDAGLIRYENVWKHTDESSYPYAGVIDSVYAITPLSDSSATLAILSESGITLATDDHSSSLNGVKMPSVGSETLVSSLISAGFAQNAWVAGRRDGIVSIINPSAKPLSEDELLVQASVSSPQILYQEES